MHVKLSTLAALALTAPFGYAQSSSASASGAASSGSASSSSSGYIQAVLGALQSANLTMLASAAEKIANSTDGMMLLSSLGNGNKTVFAPTNSAFSNVSSSVDLNNATLVTEILAYHILNNTWSGAAVATSPNHTIARTLLNMGMYALPGNKSAPLVLSKMSSNASDFMIVEPMMNVTAMGNGTTAANLKIYIIDEVLMLPLNVSGAAMEFVPSLAGVVEKAGLLEPLEMAEAITVFAPNDAAISAVMSQVGQLNSSMIQTVLANHVINGSIVYSPDLSSGNYTSAAGEPFKFMTNSSGTYVMSANSTAMIVQSDIILNNGVMHIIDGLLLNTMSDPSAAASAYSSGINNQMTMTEATGAMTAATSAAQTSGSGSSTSGAAFTRAQLVSQGGMGSILLGAIGAVVGGAWLLM
ncbi:hypothetical protein BD324DRAFT_647916 [Kockovaella imperatae]|uniref:FAS1 domain-containing protein n=1 Tax=Kockovaella imperatae TaxID=4999 RepID=A0A1Y1UUA1_9TREE|nr:hypothetical protein BD324DRAFT_647916 [Kockovaella imperatae]ORX41016.1 hypothetical protein BD324DRAFT_647916 [Kockovaella imperatae]